MKLPLLLTAELVGDWNSPGSPRVVIEVERCTSDRERDHFVKILLSEGEEGLLYELRFAPRIGTIEFNKRDPWVVSFAREMPQDGGGTRMFLGTERPMTALAIWDDPRYTHYPFAFVDLLFDRDGSASGSLTLAARVTADEKSGFVNVESFSAPPIAITKIRIED